MVYVISKDGQPLMPTKRYGKVRRLLNNSQAKVVKRCPFTIQLLYGSNLEVQAVTLGIDAGSKTIGMSASTKEKEYYSSEVTLRNDIVDLLSARRQMRRSRRNRKTRYRKARFDNRVHSKNKGWLAPSVEQKIQTHVNYSPINRQASCFNHHCVCYPQDNESLTRCPQALGSAGSQPTYHKDLDCFL